MILTCPDCSTSYFVDDAKIPDTGRVVKCASCGNRWTAHREIELDSAVATPGRETATPMGDTAAASGDQAAAEVDPAAEARPEPVSRTFRTRALDNRKLREAAATGVIWAGMAAALALMIVVAVVFRVDVVRMWPSTAGAFAGVGLAVNSVGLTIEGVEFEPALQDGHAALSVSGMIRNVEDRTIIAPPLQIRLLDKQGEPVATKIARPADPSVPPGETRHFAIAILDPPGTAADLEITFAALEAEAPPQAKPEPTDLRGAAASSLMDTPGAAPAIRDAEPLPPEAHAAPAQAEGDHD